MFIVYDSLSFIVCGRCNDVSTREWLIMKTNMLVRWWCVGGRWHPWSCTHPGHPQMLAVQWYYYAEMVSSHPIYSRSSLQTRSNKATRSHGHVPMSTSDVRWWRWNHTMFAVQWYYYALCWDGVPTPNIFSQFSSDFQQQMRREGRGTTRESLLCEMRDVRH